MVELFAYKGSTKKIDIETLDKQPKLPADVMMDNLLLYSEYEIIGHREIKDEEFSFPISYGSSIDRRSIVFLQWGLIHKELPKDSFSKYIFTEETQMGINPYGYYSIGFEPSYDTIDIIKTISNYGIFDFDKSSHYKGKWDLRNSKINKSEMRYLKCLDLTQIKVTMRTQYKQKLRYQSEINKQLK